MADDGQNNDGLDAETRRGLRILADSTKAKGSEGAARRLYKAADTGSAADYQQAEALFDSLPPEKRSSIQATAETKATTMRETKVRRKKAEQPAQAPAEFMEWSLPEPDSAEGIFQMRAPPEPEKRPAAPPPREAPPQARARAKQPTQPAPRGDSSAQTWDLGGDKPKSKRPESDAEVDDEGKDWDWRKLPDDPVLRAAKKKNAAPKSELDALREEMLRTLKD